MAFPFFTIGHSTRSIDEFTGLLNNAGARFVVDVRTVPRSRTNPQYNRDTFPQTLAERQIGKFMSEVLTLGFPDEDGEVVLAAVDKRVPDGGRLF